MSSTKGELLDVRVHLATLSQDLGRLALQHNNVKGSSHTLELHQTLAELSNGYESITIIQDFEERPSVSNAHIH